MNQKRVVSRIIIAVLLLLGVYWSYASAQDQAASYYPEGRFLAEPAWLETHLDDENLVVLDVRRDKYFDGRLIPGAIRLPWSLFRTDDPSIDAGGLFVGVVKAQEILGQHGVTRGDTVVLYDSVKRDGGATASYVFWVLDLLGHKDMKILHGGLDAWVAAGGKVVDKPKEPQAVLYQAPTDELDMKKLVAGAEIYPRLGDPYYQILDVRSLGEYVGKKLNKGLSGKGLKAGHIPGSFNLEYKLNWTDADTKKLKSYEELLNLYPGLNPDRAVITYCHSARRGSYSYFIFRLMGFKDVRLYDRSWFEWGRPAAYFPVELETHELYGPLPTIGGRASSSAPVKTSSGGKGKIEVKPADSGGYVSCGG